MLSARALRRALHTRPPYLAGPKVANVSAANMSPSVGMLTSQLRYRMRQTAIFRQVIGPGATSGGPLPNGHNPRIVNPTGYRGQGFKPAMVHPLASRRRVVVSLCTSCACSSTAECWDIDFPASLLKRLRVLPPCSVYPAGREVFMPHAPNRDISSYRTRFSSSSEMQRAEARPRQESGR